MTLHIFNPEHDIALASGLANFTAPHAGRQLRHDLGYLPALWANEGDVVLVDDEDLARKSWRRLVGRLRSLSQVYDLGNVSPIFTTAKYMTYEGQTPYLEPWGWNEALRAMLIRHGVDASLMPSVGQLQAIRQLSHRRMAARLLPQLRVEGTVGEMFACTSEDEVQALVRRFGHVVLKAPWSSSGRGLRFLSVDNAQLAIGNWLRNVVSRQSCVMVEPYYNKVKDFGMEFCSDGEGHVSYEGLSLFHTANGAYVGNVIATERWKRQELSRYIPADLLDRVQQNICTLLGQLYQGQYRGPFGVDMMVCAAPDHVGGGFLLHPCVEINLRRTMGHVALAIGRRCNPANDDDVRRVMRIEYTDNTYKLKINRL